MYVLYRNLCCFVFALHFIAECVGLCVGVCAYAHVSACQVCVCVCVLIINVI